MIPSYQVSEEFKGKYIKIQMPMLTHKQNTILSIGTEKYFFSKCHSQFLFKHFGNWE